MSDNQQEPPNPYLNRNHEDSAPLRTKGDVLAVASLLGHVTGNLNEIDKQNVGGDSQYIKAAKMNPKQVLKQMAASSSNGNIPTKPPQPNQVPAVQPAQKMEQPVQNIVSPVDQPPSVQQAPVVSQPVDGDLVKRVAALERVVDVFKRITKFKRGISYNINTSKISGNFKDPETILDIVANELAKQTKTITIKLDDKTKG